MSHHDLSKKILHTIEEKNITPKSKWFFVLKNFIFWGLFILTFFLVSILFTAIFFHLSYLDFSMVEQTGGSKIMHFFLYFPYISFLFILVVLLFALEDLLHTRYGYRIPLSRIVPGFLIFSMLMGAIATHYLDPIRVEEGIQDLTFGLYRPGILRRKQMWVRPEQGVLAGVPLALQENEMSLIDFSGKTWYVDMYGFVPLEEEALPEYIAVVGEKIGENTFRACVIKEWLPHKNFFTSLWNKNERNILFLRNNECDD